MANEILVTRGLTKRYGNHLAVDHVELSIQKGQIYGLVGRNGAGKTTIIRMVTAQTVPTEGEVSLFGASGERELSKMRARTGAMVETPSFYPYLTARQNLEYYRIQRGIPGRRVVDEVLEEVDLAGTGKKTFKNFSLGMKQRLGLALALMNRPDLLLLDEPINGLDPEGIVEFRNLLLRLNQERQTTILISSHILSELANLATCYGFLDNGMMLEQISARALEEKCRACIEAQGGRRLPCGPGAGTEPGRSATMRCCQATCCASTAVWTRPTGSPRPWWKGAWRSKASRAGGPIWRTTSCP